MTKTMQIAIDGPAAAGKSTVAKIVAERLGFIYIDTGAMYRAVTLKAVDRGVNLADHDEVGKLLADTTILLEPAEQGQRVYLDGEDVTEAIRTERVTKAVSVVAAHAAVREEMVRLQQQFSEGRGVVMDGRDIGTRVLPGAELKVFMVASVEERAKRRFDENKRRNIATPFQELKEDIEKRDKMDSERKESPLIQAEDAVLIDTTSLSIEEVAEKIISLARERLT